jgi:hypothetical protein
VRWVHEARGGLTRKMNGLGFRDWPDRECLKPWVVTPLWVELKRLGETSTVSQLLLQERLLDLGQSVVECDTLAKAKAAYEAHRDGLSLKQRRMIWRRSRS